MVTVCLDGGKLLIHFSCCLFVSVNLKKKESKMASVISLGFLTFGKENEKEIVGMFYISCK